MRSNVRRYPARRKARRALRIRKVVCRIFVIALVIFIGISAISFAKAHFFSTPESTNNISVPTASTLVKTNIQNTVSKESNDSVNVEATETTSQDEVPQEKEVLSTYVGTFELPINGATGYASVNTNLVDAPNSENVLKTLLPGTSFQIQMEDGAWWQVKVADGTIGYVCNVRCMINLPDVIPSIIYTDTNSTMAIFKSSGINIPNVTGEQLYDVEQFNQRLGKTEYNMPILYSAALKVMEAQKAALADGYSLRIYETYRPLETQKRISSNLQTLENENATVYKGILGSGWSESWFIAQSVSNHQKGFAMDVSLAKVVSTETLSTGNYACTIVTEYEEVKMPTDMHELSDRAIALKWGVKSSSKTDWTKVPAAETMTEGAKMLQDYCVNAGFTPLASEWWHFNDLDAKEAIGSNYSTGEYYLEANLSTIPQ